MPGFHFCDYFFCHQTIPCEVIGLLKYYDILRQNWYSKLVVNISYINNIYIVLCIYLKQVCICRQCILSKNTLSISVFSFHSSSSLPSLSSPTTITILLLQLLLVPIFVSYCYAVPHSSKMLFLALTVLFWVILCLFL